MSSSSAPILHDLVNVTAPTTNTTNTEKISRSSLASLTPRTTFVGIRTAAQHLDALIKVEGDPATNQHRPAGPPTDDEVVAA